MKNISLLATYLIQD